MEFLKEKLENLNMPEAHQIQKSFDKDDEYIQLKSEI